MVHGKRIGVCPHGAYEKIRIKKTAGGSISGGFFLWASVTSHTRTKHIAVWCGVYSPDWAQGRFSLAQGRFGMENAPLLVKV